MNGGSVATDNPADDRGGRELDEDHDLLTYNESGARIREEVAAMQAQIAELAERAAAGDEGATRMRAATQLRLDRLVALGDRLRRRAETDRNGSGFLTYDGPGSTLR
jgi:hypothetical protein